MPGQLCRKLRQSQPEKSGQVGQAFLQQLPLKLSGSERDNYSQLGNNFKTATSRQLVGKWAMTVLKMRPKLGLIFSKAVQMVTKRPVYRLVTMMVTSFGDEGPSKLFPRWEQLLWVTSVQDEQKLIVLMMGTVSMMIWNFGP
jgi:hypothetical protein